MTHPPTSATELLVSHLVDSGRKVNTSGENAWVAQCPAHDDGRPSLSIRRIPGQALVKCFAGCRTEDVTAALGFTMADLYDNKKGVDYTYRHKGIIVRNVHRTPDKGFSQSVIDKDNVVLYNPADLDSFAGLTVYVPEGEKDVDVLVSVGVTAVTSPMGAASWAKCDYTPLKDAAEVIIVADTDQAGEDRAIGLQNFISEWGTPCRVVQAKAGKDATDHIMAGHNVEEFVTMKLATVTKGPGRTLVTERLADVKTRRQQWAYLLLVPLRVLTILAGTGGIGKSTILAWLVAGLTRGLFAGDFLGKPVAVGFIAAEDDTETSLVPRLKAAGADIDLLFSFSTVEHVDADGNRWRSLPTLSADLMLLKAALIENNIRVLIIDPVLSIMEGDAIKAGDVRRNLDPLASLANELDIAIILVAHFNKSSGNASDKLSGSHAFRDIARSVLLLAVDEETNQRILSVDKSNYSPDSPSFAFTIETVTVPTDDDDIAAVGQARLLGASAISVHDIVKRGNDDGLSDLSVDILALARRHAPGDIGVSDITDAFPDCTPEKARTYAGRLVTTGRLARSGRGRFRDIDTPPSNESSVS